MVRRAHAVVCAALLLGWLDVAAGCCSVPDDWIRFENSEQQMELEARAALDAAELRYSVERVKGDDSDVYLATEWGNEETPPFRIVVDTIPASDDGRERAMVAYLYTDVMVRPEGRQATLEVLNSINGRTWTGALFLDDNGEVRGSWGIGSRADGGLPGFVVGDMVERTAGVWFETWPRLRDCGPCGAVPNVDGEEVPEGAEDEGAERGREVHRHVPPDRTPG